MYTKNLVTTLSMLSICVILVIYCYFYIDKPVAEFFYVYHGLTKTESLLRISVRFSTVLLEYLPPFIFLFFLLKNNIFRPLGKNEKVFMAIALSATLATSIKNILKFVFGRYWPATFIGNNPSWLQSHKYGFNFFHSGASYNSFPSGHTAAIFAIMTIIWIIYPKWRWLSMLSCATMMISLVVLDYHFVSDVIAGMFLGIITAQNITYYFLRPHTNIEPKLHDI
jgi:membrane-associated phospholipid phosphatase